MAIFLDTALFVETCVGMIIQRTITLDKLIDDKTLKTLSLLKSNSAQKIEKYTFK